MKVAGRNDPAIDYPFAAPPAEGAWTCIARDIYWARLPLPMKLDHVNVYALRDAFGWTLVDTGFNSRRTRAIWQVLLAALPGDAPLGRVVVTHHHPDHVGCAGWLQATHGAELLMPRTGWLMARMLQLDVQEVPNAETVAFYTRAGMAPEILAQRRAERPFNFSDVTAPLPLGYTRLRDGDVLHMAGRAWDVRMGDGHAPEHATFWCRSEPLVLSGDQILPSISPNLGVYATEPGADPVGDWIDSCRRLAEHARADHLVLCGHKLPFTGLPVRLSQLEDNHHSALARLVDHLRTPRSAAECFQPLFRREIGPGEYGLALVEAVAHVSHLHQTGRAHRSLRADGAWIYQCG